LERFGGILGCWGVFRKLAAHEEAALIEGHLMADHVHMCLSIPPKYAVSQVVGYIKREERDPDRETAATAMP